MTTIVTRSGKGSALSWTEVDDNFTNLNTDKAPVDSPTFTGTVSGISAADVTLVPTGNLSSTNVQVGIAELESEKAALAGAAFSGNVSIPKTQMGVSVTASENHFWDGSTANQLSLKRGTPTSPGASVISIASGLVTFTNGGLQDGPTFRATNTGGATANTTAKISITSEQFDTASCYDTTLSRFTPNVAGYYHIEGVLSGASVPAGGYVFPKIYKNGTLYETGSSVGVQGQITSDFSTNVSAIVFMNGTTDYVELWSTLVLAPNVTGSSFSGFLARRAL